MGGAFGEEAMHGADLLTRSFRGRQESSAGC